MTEADLNALIRWLDGPVAALCSLVIVGALAFLVSAAAQAWEILA